VVDVVEETLKGHVVKILAQKKDDQRRLGGARLDLPKIRKNPLVEIIPINTGCLNHCTYCKTKHARGDLASYDIEEIVDRVKSVVEEGVVEIWLTSEDTGTYGRDIGKTLPQLLWNVIEQIPEGVMLRVGMTNPPYILEYLEEIAKILNHPWVYSFLHIPVQAGSNKVLNLMKREYTIEEFKNVVDFLRQKVPGITIATDIICGFPQETEEDFQQTYELVEQYRFPVLYISQFYPRPGTPAARMPRVPTQQVKERSRAITRLFESYQTYDHHVSSIQVVIVTDLTPDGLQYVAHNKFYEQVLISKEERDDLMGKMFKVQITHAGKHFMLGAYAEDQTNQMNFTSRPLPKGFLSIPKKSFEAQHLEEPADCEEEGGCGDNCECSDSNTTTKTSANSASTSCSSSSCTSCSSSSCDSEKPGEKTKSSTTKSTKKTENNKEKSDEKTLIHQTIFLALGSALMARLFFKLDGGGAKVALFSAFGLGLAAVAGFYRQWQRQRQ